MEKKCFVAGLPDAGKTTFIAALWDIIKRKGSSLELRFLTTPDNTAYLNEIWEYWVSMKKIERSKTPAPDDITINVKREADGTELVLDLPDFMGEQFQKVIDHTLPENIQKWIAQSDRMLFLINNLNDSLKDDLEDEEEQSEGAIDRAKEKDEAPRLAPEKMLLASQNMMVLKYIANHAKMKKVAIGLSAWDVKMKEGKSPEEFLRQRSPVLYNFIKYHFSEVVFFGVSAQGFDYKEVAAKEKEMREKTRNSDRAFIVFDKDNEPSPDLTKPLNYLIS